MDKLWREASSNIDVEIETNDEISYLYSGYKITKNKDNKSIDIYNIRISDFYNKITGSLLDRFINNGFIKTCDELQIEKDDRRVVIADWYIMKAILSKDESKKKRVQEERLDLLKKINNLKHKIYA